MNSENTDILQSKISGYRKQSLIRRKIEVKPSPIHRHGVFAKERILSNCVIEECPVILFPKNNDATADFEFIWNDKYSAVALGYGSIYNHSNQPNAFVHIDLENGLIKIIAHQTIYRGEEILINYGNEWFAGRDMELIPPPNKIGIYRLLYYSGIILFMVLMALVLQQYKVS